MATYTIHFFNNSTVAGSFSVFQKMPDQAGPNVFSLAWLAKFTNPNTRLSFSWTLDHCFTWAETGQLVPGITFEASEVLPATLNENNTVTLTKSDGAHQFINQTSEGQPGSLTITADNTIPPNQTSVGVGMSGSGTFAVQAAPNMNFVFTPHPQYWVAFGNFHQGQALQTSEITNTAQVVFPPNIYAMNVTLNRDNTWTITQVND
ncbi:hypothetical protein JN11_01353 [Mucilaginibacter frigoritolerans]|uniref:Protein rhiA n=1 Tax=Mucilaginibacter frigoritolerans TaxID=652788 RepID=A0A562UB17_9SPHI|nr:protein rhiA [Mucilaginibacter frigoritolerans]TWJ02381.1 hypothetical protein JN11_01353 [Mucilaginibacter frigoritolerans]